MAEADPLEAQAIHNAVSDHDDLMRMGTELFQRVGSLKKESIRHAMALCEQGFPLKPAKKLVEDFGPLGKYDNTLHQEYTGYLTSRAGEIRRFKHRLQYHYQTLHQGEDYRRKEAEAAQMLAAIDKAYDWATSYERDEDASRLLKRLRSGREGLKDASRIAEELARMQIRLDQVRHDVLMALKLLLNHK